MENQEALLASQAQSNAYRILSKITQVHGGQFEFPDQDSKIAEFTKEQKKLFESLAKFREEDIKKLEKDIEDSRQILAGSEFCKTLVEIAHYFSGICAEVRVLENTELLQKQMRFALKLLKKAAGHNKDLEELYRLWYVQELARKLRRFLQNSRGWNIFLRVVISVVSSTLVGFLAGFFLDVGKLIGNLPPWLGAIIFIVSTIISGIVIGHAVMGGLDLVADLA